MLISPSRHRQGLSYSNFQILQAVYRNLPMIKKTRIHAMCLQELKGMNFPGHDHVFLGFPGTPTPCWTETRCGKHPRSWCTHNPFLQWRTILAWIVLERSLNAASCYWQPHHIIPSARDDPALKPARLFILIIPSYFKISFLQAFK